MTQIQRLMLNWFPQDQAGSLLKRQISKPHSRRFCFRKSRVRARNIGDFDGYKGTLGTSASKDL